MLNSFQHHTNNENLKQVQADRKYEAKSLRYEIPRKYP